MSGHNSSTHLRALGAALLVTVLWSSSWILIRWGLDDEALEPLTFAALRYGLAAAVLVAWVLARPGLRNRLLGLSRSAVTRLVVLGAVFYALTQGAQFVAIDNQPAATTALVLSLTPLLVAWLAKQSLAEMPTGRQVAGAALVAFGAALYFAGDLGATAIGMAAALVGLGSNVVASVLGRGVNRRTDTEPVVVTAVSMAVGAALLVIVGVGTEGIPDVSLRAWAIIGWLALINTALAFTLWNLSLQHLSAVESAGINNTMLIQIAVLAWVFLDEAPGLWEVVGVVLVSVGVFFTQAALAPRDRGQRAVNPPSRKPVDEPRRAEVRQVIEATVAWAAERADVAAVGLVGSWARNEATMASDVDVIVLTTEPDHYVEGVSWWSFLGAASLIRTRGWGRLIERRVRLASGLEVEFGIADPSWAAVDPVDPGTRKVVSAGMNVLHDPDGLLSRLGTVCLDEHSR